jgi:hypothetical protein
MGLKDSMAERKVVVPVPVPLRSPRVTSESCCMCPFSCHYSTRVTIAMVRAPQNRKYKRVMMVDDDDGDDDERFRGREQARINPSSPMPNSLS